VRPTARIGATGLAALIAGLLLWVVVAQATPRPRDSGAIQLPDLRIFVPVDRISIGLSPDTGDRELRFTHITADIGSGPFEIDPHYDSQTGVSTFTQAIYRSAGAGQWTYDHSVPVAATGVWHPPSDYAFPLTRFVLDRVQPDGSPGATAAVSPKTDYCITGDTQLSGIPDTPDQTFIPVEDCTDPTKPLGWSVGWGDEYDETDAGQPIDLTGVPDGDYLLRATVDPEHVLTESSTANDVTDTLLHIAGDSVSVISQSLAGVPLPSAALSSPTHGARLSGMVRLVARVSPAPGSSVRTVQFVLDGQPFGPALHRGPYAIRWNTAQSRPGLHLLSVRVTDADGTMNSARPVPVRVITAPAVRVVAGRWHRGHLFLRLAFLPRRDEASAVIRTRNRTRTYHLRGGRLSVRTGRPQRISLRLTGGGHPIESPISFGLNDRPSIHLIAPSPHLTLSGIVPVTVSASDPIGVRAVVIRVDGRRIATRTHPPYTVELDTRHLRRGAHTLSVTALNGLGNRGVSVRRILVRNPAPPMTCFVMQAKTSAFGQTTASTGPVHTILAGETLLALVSADGPADGRQSAAVAGGALHWRLKARANGSAGDSEIWSAQAVRPVHVESIAARASVPGYSVDLTVIAMEGTAGVGATAAGSAPTGAPSIHLTTLSRASLVFAAGNDWDTATARTLPTGWEMLEQRLDAGTGDTFWSQYTDQPTGRAGQRIRIADLAPTTDRWNLAAVELINSGD
jgi:hypothetical protein